MEKSEDLCFSYGGGEQQIPILNGNVEWEMKGTEDRLRNIVAQPYTSWKGTSFPLFLSPVMLLPQNTNGGCGNSSSCVILLGAEVMDSVSTKHLRQSNKEAAAKSSC